MTLFGTSALIGLPAIGRVSQTARRRFASKKPGGRPEAFPPGGPGTGTKGAATSFRARELAVPHREEAMDCLQKAPGVSVGVAPVLNRCL